MTKHIVDSSPVGFGGLLGVPCHSTGTGSDTERSCKTCMSLRGGITSEKGFDLSHLSLPSSSTSGASVHATGASVHAQSSWIPPYVSNTWSVTICSRCLSRLKMTTDHVVLTHRSIPELIGIIWDLERRASCCHGQAYRGVCRDDRQAAVVHAHRAAQMVASTIPFWLVLEL